MSLWFNITHVFAHFDTNAYCAYMTTKKVEEEKSIVFFSESIACRLIGKIDQSIVKYYLGKVQWRRKHIERVPFQNIYRIYRISIY